MTSKSLAFYLPDGRIAAPENPFGRHVANAGTYRALARSGRWQHLHVLSNEPVVGSQLASELGVNDDDVAISTGPLMSTAGATASGTLLSGQAYLSQPAWIRRQARCDRDYSIVGTIFAFSSPSHRELMMHSLLAPVQEWDAVICSSPSLQRTVLDTIEAWESYLRDRMGSSARLPRPQLPIIGFGSEVRRIERQAADAAARARMRARLGIELDEVMVFSLGRLSYVDKAFPQAMFKTVQAARESSAVGMHLVMAGWFAQGEVDRSRYEEAIRRYSPDVPVTFVDGNDQAAIGECWAAADAFMLLSDTIIETFGQALVEAMAAGLPLVVSDWDGYRSIVRQGVDGFLIPTLGAAPGRTGEALAMLEYVGATGYANYSGSVSAHTAVDVAAAATALARLAASPSLRRSMGEAGRSRARQEFDWPVVVGQYGQLFDELAARRAATTKAAVTEVSFNPLRDDPFRTFARLPTMVLSDEVRLMRGPMDAPDRDVWLDGAFPGVRGTDEEARAVLTRLDASQEVTVRDVVAGFPSGRRAFIRMTISWLAKAGAIAWTPATRDHVDRG